MKTTKLGTTGPNVSALALGCMGLSGIYGQTTDDDGVRTIHAAVDRGITLLDTGDFYGMGHNEMLIGRALRELPKGKRDALRISVKFGAMRGPDGAWLGLDTRPAALKNFITYSMKRLGIDVVDIYRPARLDPNVPIEETIGGIQDLVTRGYVRHIGLSEMGIDTIRRAHAVHPIVDLQIEYAIVTRNPEDKIFPALQELGISATLYGVFSRGLLSGSKVDGPADARKHFPRFAPENQAKNEAIATKLKEFSAAHGRTPAQTLIAWTLWKYPTFVPLVGLRTVGQVEDAIAALDKPMQPVEAAELEVLIPRDAIAGTRYGAAQMAVLDSERS